MCEYFYDLLGNRASIKENANHEFRLVIKDRNGKIEKDKTYTCFHGAKSALGRTGIWLSVPQTQNNASA